MLFLIKLSMLNDFEREEALRSFEKAPNADYLYEDMGGLTNDIRAKIELRADSSMIYVKFLEQDRVVQFYVGFIGPKRLAESIRKTLKSIGG